MIGFVEGSVVCHAFERVTDLRFQFLQSAAQGPVVQFILSVFWTGQPDTVRQTRESVLWIDIVLQFLGNGLQPDPLGDGLTLQPVG